MLGRLQKLYAHIPQYAVVMTAMYKLVAEVIGVFIIATVILLQGDAIAIAISVAAAIYIAMPISGAMFNPAMTIASLFNGMMSVEDAVVYTIAELGGAMAAFWFVQFVKRQQALAV